MKIRQLGRHVAVAWALASVCIGGFARGAEIPARPAAAVPTITDVALSRGSLNGQVVTAEGAPVGGSIVAAVQNGQVVSSTHADDSGWFTLTELRGGTYQLQTENGATVVRAWTELAAPPAAQPHALVVADGQVMRGQGAVRNVLTNPWFWGVGIGAAVAVPLIIVTTDDKEPRRGS
jgi:hypothetical protein